MDILKAIELPAQYDVIVSNPPYVRNLEKEKMQLNVLNFEPDSALFVSDEIRWFFIKRSRALAKNHLTTNGLLLFRN